MTVASNSSAKHTQGELLRTLHSYLRCHAYDKYQEFVLLKIISHQEITLLYFLLLSVSQKDKFFVSDKIFTLLSHFAADNRIVYGGWSTILENGPFVNR